MSKTIHISSESEFEQLRQSSKILVTDFYADWCGPCKQIAPMYEQLSAKLSRPKQMTFVKVNVDTQPATAQKYGVTAMPTFMVFKSGNVVETVRGANPRQLQAAVQKLAQEAEGASGSGSGGFGEGSSSGSDSGTWLGAALPRGYQDITDQVEIKGMDLLNWDTNFGNSRTLISNKKPSVLADGAKGKGKSEGADKDWVESDTDEQLMFFIPFQVTVKAHTLHITSLPPAASEDGDDDDDELPMRPKTINIYSNRAHVLGFDEAEGVPETQKITLRPQDWDPKTGTAKIELRFVKFQNVTSLVVFVVDGEGGREKVRVDRIRVIGESGEKMGKLEKIDHGE